jgi:hypothetical protein
MVNASGLELLHKMGANPAKKNQHYVAYALNLPQIRGISAFLNNS